MIKPKSITLITAITLTFIFCPTLCVAEIPENAIPIEIYRGIGKVIDESTAHKYGLFDNIPNFVSATYYETPTGLYFIELKTFDENGILVVNTNEVPKVGLEWIRQKIEKPQRAPQTTQPTTTPDRDTRPLKNYRHSLKGVKELSGDLLFTSSEGTTNIELSPSFGYFFTNNLEIELELGISSASDDAQNSLTLTSVFASAIFNAVGEESIIGAYGGLGGGFVRATASFGNISNSVTKSAISIVGGIKTFPTKNNKIGFGIGYTLLRYAGLSVHSVGTSISIYFPNR